MRFINMRKPEKKKNHLISLNNYSIKILSFNLILIGFKFQSAISRSNISVNKFIIS